MLKWIKQDKSSNDCTHKKRSSTSLWQALPAVHYTPHLHLTMGWPTYDVKHLLHLWQVSVLASVWTPQPCNQFTEIAVWKWVHKFCMRYNLLIVLRDQTFTRIPISWFAANWQSINTWLAWGWFIQTPAHSCQYSWVSEALVRGGSTSPNTHAISQLSNVAALTVKLAEPHCRPVSGRPAQVWLRHVTLYRYNICVLSL